MAAINARFVFTPTVPGVTQSAPISVNGENMTEIKLAAKAVLAAKRLVSQNDVNAIDAADASLDG
jgi:hypothetical protein